MKVDFQIDDTKYRMDFEDLTSQAHQRTYGYDGAFALVINPAEYDLYPIQQNRVRYRGISKDRIMWHKYKDSDLPQSVINYCNRIIKLLIFG